MNYFCLGLPKTGTVTLSLAFLASGIRCAHWYSPHADKFVGRSLYAQFFKGADPLADFAKFDAITQADLISAGESYWPQMDYAFLKAVRQYHPDCVFILNYRAPAKTARSISNWNDLQARLVKLGAPGLPPQSAARLESIEHWVEGHYATVRDWFSGDSHFFEYDVEAADVPSLFRQHLGLELAWWGHANVSGGGESEIPPDIQARIDATKKRMAEENNPR